MNYRRPSPVAPTERLLVGLGLSLFVCACDLPNVDIDDDTAGDTDSAVDGDDGDDVAASEGTDDTGAHPEDCTVGDGVDDDETGPASDTPPEIIITLPAADATNDAGPNYDGFDEELMLWYYDVSLAAEATDLEDGDLGMAVEWTTDQVQVQDAALGTGAEVSVRVYSDDCFGTTHTLTATVTDADGNTASAVRLLNIWTLC